MKKIIEGIFGFKNVDDNVFAITENLTPEEKELISDRDLTFVNLNMFDENGYNEKSTVVNEKIYSYSFKKVCDGKRLLFAKHQNIPHDTLDRGRKEVIHFVNYSLDDEIKSIALIGSSLFTKDISKYVLEKENLTFEEIKDLVINNELTYEEFSKDKVQIIELLNHIIFAKKSAKTLYICYKLCDIDNFHKHFSSALKLLTKDVSDDISYVTCFGGGTSNQFDVVGVAIEPGKIKEMNFDESGIVYQYPKSEYVASNKEVSDNPLNLILNEIDQKIEFFNFIDFFKKNYASDGTFDGYLKYLDFYNLISYKNALVENKEHQFMSNFSNLISFFCDNLSLVLHFDESTLNLVYQNIEQQVGEFKKIIEVSIVDEEIIKIVKLLLSTYQSINDKQVRSYLMNWIYTLLFDFDYLNRDPRYLSEHSDLLINALAIESLDELIFTQLLTNESIYRKNLELSDILLSNERGVEFESIFYSRLFQHLFERYENNSSYRKIIAEVVSKYLAIVLPSIDLVELLFQEQKDIHKSFEIVSASIVLISNSELESVLDSLNQYVCKNDLIDEALVEIKTSSFTGESREKIFKLKNLIIDSFIVNKEIVTYKELVEFVRKLDRYNNNPVVFNEIKTRFITNHLSPLVVDSVEELTLSIIRSEEINNLELILRTFKKNREEIPTRIVECIEKKKLDVKEYERIQGREDALINFRIDFIARATSLLPEKDSRPILYKYVDKKEADAAIGLNLNLNKEQYSDASSALAVSFLQTKEEDKSVVNGKSEQHRRFTKEIFEAQNKKRFNIHTVATIAESTMSLVLFAAFGLVLSFGLSLLSYNFIVDKTYLTFFIILSIVVGALSGLIGLINMKNKGRKKVYLIALIECASLAVIGVGLFSILIVILGGR